MSFVNELFEHINNEIQYEDVTKSVCGVRLINSKPVVEAVDKYKAEDVGCYYDGVRGDAGLAEKLAELIEPFNPEAASTLVQDIRNDDSNDTVMDAVSVLQDNTEEGLIWVLEGGDLCLISEAELEEGKAKSKKETIAALKKQAKEQEDARRRDAEGKEKEAHKKAGMEEGKVEESTDAPIEVAGNIEKSDSGEYVVGWVIKDPEGKKQTKIKVFKVEDDAKAFQSDLMGRVVEEGRIPQGQDSDTEMIQKLLEITDEAFLKENELMKKDETFLEENKLEEKAPGGWSGTVKAMKAHKDIDNPFALAWYMKKKGYRPHVAKESVEKVEEATTWLDLGWRDLDVGDAPNLKGYSVRSKKGEVIKIKSADEKFIQLENGKEIRVGDDLVFAKTYQLLDPKGNVVQVDKAGVAESKVQEAVEVNIEKDQEPKDDVPPPPASVEDKPAEGQASVSVSSEDVSQLIATLSNIKTVLGITDEKELLGFVKDKVSGLFPKTEIQAVRENEEPKVEEGRIPQGQDSDEEMIKKLLESMVVVASGITDEQVAKDLSTKQKNGKYVKDKDGKFMVLGEKA